MQRYCFTFLLTLFVVPSVCAHSFIDHLRKHLDKEIQQQYQDVCTRKKQEINNLFNTFNPTPVSSENEQFIRAVLNEVDLDGNAINLWHKPGVYACAIGPNICIDQDWFNTLNEEQKRFVIGHEAMHIKGKHLDYKTYLLMNRDKFEPVEMLSLGFDFETEADLKAAKALKCFDGGISVLESFRKQKLQNGCTMIDDHPSCAERIFNLRKLKDQMQKKAPKKASESSWGSALSKWLWWQKNSKATSAA